MSAKKSQIVEDTEPKVPNITDIEWTDYVLGFLSEDEKIAGNPTTDGLRRIFETVMNCKVISSTSNVVQAPDQNNEKRATVVHTIQYISTDPKNSVTITVGGAADVYWGNCDKIYRNHPVAVAETRAEGRALRRGLRLRKVVAAEELAKDIEDHPDGHNINKISNNQLNFIDVISQRLDINTKNMIVSLGHDAKNIYNIEHTDAINIIKTLSSYQQDPSLIPKDMIGYDANWK